MPVTAKICGLSDAATLDAAVAGGASHIGFVFFPPSPRCVGFDQVAALAARMPDDVRRVGVFVDPIDEWLDTAIAAGLDYPGIGPEHVWLKEQGRVDYISATDREALDAFQLLARTEGILPALEPSHGLAAAARVARTMDRDAIILANLCGRGDKDMTTVADALGVAI